MKKHRVIVAIGMACILLVASPAFAGDTLDLPAWKALIMSKSEKERALAKGMILEHKEVFAQNTDLIQELISIVSMPVTEGENFYGPTTSRNIAIFLLGKLQAKEAVPVLIDWLVPRKGQLLILTRLPVFSPAGYALIDIGLPSVPPLVDKLKSEGTSLLGNVCLDIIVRIKGLEQTRLLLQSTLTDETDPARSLNLSSCLELVNNPPPGLLGLDKAFKQSSTEIQE